MQTMPAVDFVVSGTRQCCRNCSTLIEIKIVYKENEISKDIICGDSFLKFSPSLLIRWS